MKKEIYKLLKNLNSLSNEELIKIDLKLYVDKIYTLAKFISYHKNGELIGFVAYYDNMKSKEYAYLTMLAVNPKHHGKGYGKRLLENAIDDLREMKFQKFKLEVLQNEKKVIDLYNSYGFITSELKDYTQYMIKKL